MTRHYAYGEYWILDIKHEILQTDTEGSILFFDYTEHTYVGKILSPNNISDPIYPPLKWSVFSSI